MAEKTQETLQVRDELLKATEDVMGNTDVTEAVLAEVMAASAATEPQVIA